MRTSTQAPRGVLPRWLIGLLALVVMLAGCSNDPSSAPAITAQPVDVSAVAGSAATLSVQVTGTVVGFQWQSSTDGGATWADVPGAVASSYTTPAVSAADNGKRFRVIVISAAGAFPSSAVTLTVTGSVVAPGISVAPSAASVVAPAAAIFSVTATGTGLAFQWQLSTDNGVTWSAVAGAQSASHDVGPTSAAMNGRMYRVIVSNSAGTVTSPAALLTVAAAPVAPQFTLQPGDTSVIVGAAAVFTAAVTGTPTPTLQWQRSTNAGGTWTNLAGAITASYDTGSTTLSQDGELYRVVATSSGGTVASSAARLTVSPAPQAPAIVTQPADRSVSESVSATFSAAASGVPTPTWQWQLSTDNGVTWANVNGATAASYSTPPTVASDNGRRYRAVASNTAGSATTLAALLTVTAPVGFPANAALLAASDSTNGMELWMTDGTSTGTVLVKDINPGAGNSIPQQFTRFGPHVYFVADDGAHGRELWRTDGTGAGTNMVVDLNPGASSSFPVQLSACNGALFFGASDGANQGLWKSDGTAAGTVRLSNSSINNGTRTLFCSNNVVYFGGRTAANGRELWRSDGTVAGTFLLKDIEPGTGDSSPQEFVNFLGQVYFSTANGLWRTDGTAAGTTPVATGLFGAPSWLAVNGGTLYFSGLDASGSEPWKSDGTPGGTAMIVNLNAASSSYPFKFTVSNGITYFVAEQFTGSQQLFRTDGTASNTVAVHAISPGQVAVFGDSILDVNGTLYFLANQSGFGTELWKTDGTDQGTLLVSDIQAGPNGSRPTSFFTLGGVLYFNASDGVSGAELWRSEGLAANTVLVKDICEGGCSSDPQPR